MAKIKFEYETKYEIGDVVLFAKENISKEIIMVGIIKNYNYDCESFWYDIQYSKNGVYDYNHYGDIAEYEIICKIENEDEKERLRRIISEREIIH